MTHQINRASPAAAAADSTSQRLIAEWTVGESSKKHVCLFRTPNHFSFSSEGPLGKQSTFKHKLYDSEYATNLVSMFRRTIGVNLEKEEAHPSCFLPKLVTSVINKPEIQVALFGQIDTRNNHAGDLKGLRWGVLNTSTSQEQTFEVRDPIAELFMRTAPLTNTPKMGPAFDKEKKPILDVNGTQVIQEMLEDQDHYAFTFFARRFSVSLDCDTDDGIRGVSLHCVSLFDRSVRLTQRDWAVTLLSSPYDFLRKWGECFSGIGNTGHSWIACEGVNENGPWMKYIHATINPRYKKIKLNPDEGIVEIFDMNRPSIGTMNGPTWIRSKALVENMIRHAIELGKKPVKFSASSRFSYGEPAFLADLFRHLPDARKIPNLEYLEDTIIHRSCIGWARRIVYECGIILGRNSKETPNNEVNRIKAAGLAIMPHNLPPEDLEQTPSVVAHMKSAEVFLVPVHCSLEECKKWTTLWSKIQIEKTGVDYILKQLSELVKEDRRTVVETVAGGILGNLGGPALIVGGLVIVTGGVIFLSGGAVVMASSALGSTSGVLNGIISGAMALGSGGSITGGVALTASGVPISIAVAQAAAAPVTLAVVGMAGGAVPAAVVGAGASLAGAACIQAGEAAMKAGKLSEVPEKVFRANFAQ